MMTFTECSNSAESLSEGVILQMNRERSRLAYERCSYDQWVCDKIKLRNCKMSMSRMNNDRFSGSGRKFGTTTG